MGKFTAHLLPERTSFEVQAVAFPSLVTSEHSDYAAGHLPPQPTKPLLEPPTRLVTAKLVGNTDSYGPRHVFLPD